MHYSKLLFISSALFFAGCQSSNVLDPQFSLQQKVQTYTLDTSVMMDHLKSFEKIAVQNGGNRSVGSAGGQASAAYIVEQAKKLGLPVQAIAFQNRNKMMGQNILVEITGQSKETAILLGAHYDSVKMGPGINDNASGVALLLELMKQISSAQTKPKNTIYFAFWDSEEDGIGGSQDYVKHLSTDQLNGIKAYINVDMVGTKNPNIQIADGDKSSIADMKKMFEERGVEESVYKSLIDNLNALPSHSGDIDLENILRDFFKQKNISVKDDATTLTASDTAAFLGKVPVTQLILFNEQLKGEELEFAPCYHKACDTIDLIDPNSLKIAGEAIVYLLNRLDS